MTITFGSDISIDFLIITTPTNVITVVTVGTVNHTIIIIIILAKTFTGTFITATTSPILEYIGTIFTNTPRIIELTFPGTGCITTADTIRLSKEAEKIGVDVLSVITPSFAAASQHELYCHYSELGKNVDTPIVVYNIPARTGNKVLPETIGRLAKDVDVIVGAKDSSGDWNNLLGYINETKDLDKDFRVLSGNDSLILPALKAGGAGGIAGCSNVYPKTLTSIYNKFIEGDIEGAEVAQESIASFRAVFKYGNPNTVVKKAAAMLGNPVGDLRKPFNYLSPEGMEALEKVLEENKAKGMA